MCEESIDFTRNQIIDLIYSLDVFTSEELIQLSKKIPGDDNIKIKIIEDLLFDFPLADLHIYYGHFFVKH